MAPKPKAGLALLLGPEKGEPDGDEYEAGSDFESAAVDAFPELDGQPERIAAFKQAIMACCEGMKGGM